MVKYGNVAPNENKKDEDEEHDSVVVVFDERRMCTPFISCRSFIEHCACPVHVCIV